MSDRKQLAAFLKARRAALDPATAGFASQPRRRVAGLRREEVAELAGISPDWYTRLEQGRDVGASRTVLERLASALRLSPAESGHLFSLAGFTSGAVPAEDVDSRDLERTAHHLLLESLNPHPAYYITGRWVLVALNSAARLVFPELVAPETDGNVLRMIFCNRDFRSRQADWKVHARQCVAIFRGDYGRNVSDVRFRQLVAELTVVSAEFAEWWPRHDVAARSPTVKRFNDPRLGPLDFTTQYFHASEYPGLVLVVFVGDAATQKRISRALGGHAVPRERRVTR